MKFDYEVIAKMAADISKQMLKLNNQLDKVIDKQNELADAQEQKAIAIKYIEENQWEEAAKVCSEQAKEDIKRIKLSEEEQAIRIELESLRENLVSASNGEIKDLPAAEE